jgi:membrane protein DedA with SNARE-associated domain
MEQIESLLRDLGEYIRAHREWAAPIVFLIAFAECATVLSWTISTLLFFAVLGAAATAYDGYPLPLALAASFGAGFGFWLSYWLGLVLGPHIGDRWPFKSNPHWLAQGHAFFEKWGILGIFFGHFFPPARGAIATVAGIVRMPFISFQLANWSASFIWGFAALYSVGRFSEYMMQLTGK